MNIKTLGFGILTGLIGLFSNNYVIGLIDLGTNDVIILIGIGLAMVSLDRVMQAPGGPEEDTSGGFNYGGWTVPFVDGSLGNTINKELSVPFDLLLGMYLSKRVSKKVNIYGYNPLILEQRSWSNLISLRRLLNR
ncbi:MAG TPA: hypothetical protein VFU67_04450 [Nitrososphaeraceae archaeon]|nr:hypothetical protein [Nitrososphaeraceae archaeon]